MTSHSNDSKNKSPLLSRNVRENQHDQLQVGTPKDSAGGAPAVLSSLKHAQTEMGLLRATQTLLRVNQQDGFDCPGCAWPDPEDHRSMVEFCENGAKAVAEEATLSRVTPEFFSQWSISELLKQTDYWLGKQGRITHPVLKKADSDHYQEIPWAEAFKLIACELRALKNPNQAIFYTSGRTSNEAAFLYQLFVRKYGTNNLPDCSNMCHESSGVALKETVGIGKGTVTLEDFELADCILILGQNPGTNHPRMLTVLQKAARGGCKIISINPLAEAGLTRFKNPQEVSGWVGRGTPLTTLHLPVKINGDVALLKGIMKELLAMQESEPDRGSAPQVGNRFDYKFIEEFTDGYSEWIKNLEGTSWEDILASSGLSRQQIREAAQICHGSKKMICCWAMGLTQHENAVANIQEVVNLLLLGGHIGRPGAGVCPVRGHSNVQGDRTMGIWEKAPDEFLDALGKEFGFEPPRHHGYDTLEAIEAMHAGKAKVFVGMGGNFAAATPDPQFTHLALSRCSLTVQISTKLNRSHLITGQQALILPCLGRTEEDLQATGLQYVSTENSMGIIQKSEGRLKPASALLRSEVAIVAGMAEALFGEAQPVEWRKMAENYDFIRASIERVIPGFENYNSRLKLQKSFALPNPVRDERKFPTLSGKARFTVHTLPSLPVTPEGEDPSGRYLLMTIRSHDQYNTTIYGLDDRYRGIYGGREVVLMNTEDMAQAGFAGGDWVDISSRSGRVQHYRVVPYSIPRQCVATYFPETNCLVPIDHKARKSNTPVYKSAWVKIVKHPSPAALKNPEQP